MGYLHIENLYKNQEILLFKECYAMEKIHGTSAHIGVWYTKWDPTKQYTVNDITFFSGGEKPENFIKLFDGERLIAKLIELNLVSITIFGEAYGGKCQGMSGTYGKELKFIAFDVKIGDNWLDVPRAEEICKQLGIEFVHYEKVPTDLEVLDKLASANSIQAQRNEMGEKLREGIVLRPLIEVKKNNGDRIIAKHKNAEFAERVSQPKLVKLTQDKLEVLKDAEKIADEWVTMMRLKHVIDKIEAEVKLGIGIEMTKEVITGMIEDITREAKGEIIDNKVVRTLIGKRTATLFKQYLNDRMRE